jgi:hypothetical protein
MYYTIVLDNALKKHNWQLSKLMRGIGQGPRTLSRDNGILHLSDNL